jgi:polyhydroxyalkanoate synthesis repressor PhaR
MMHRIRFLFEEGAYVDNTGEKQELRRVIKRYSNRKLYDTRDSRYVTLLQIAEMVRRGEDVQIIDNTTKEDKTEVTLALAISEELKAKPRSVPLGTLRNLIQERGEKILTSLRDGPIGRLIPEDADQEGRTKQEGEKPERERPEADRPEKDREKQERDKQERTGLADLVATSRHTIDQWQHAIDERIRAVLPNFSLFLDIQSELRRLTQRVQFLEERLGQRLQRGGADEKAREVGSSGDSSGERSNLAPDPAPGKAVQASETPEPGQVPPSGE